MNVSKDTQKVMSLSCKRYGTVAGEESLKAVKPLQRKMENVHGIFMLR
jgi:hypothetical protein